MKRLEQRLYEAFDSGTGIRLSVEDVKALIHDEAIAARISNIAAEQAGILDPPGSDCINHAYVESWSLFVQRLKDSA